MTQTLATLIDQLNETAFRDRAEEIGFLSEAVQEIDECNNALELARDARNQYLNTTCTSIVNTIEQMFTGMRENEQSKHDELIRANKEMRTKLKRRLDRVSATDKPDVKKAVVTLRQESPEAAAA